MAQQKIFGYANRISVRPGDEIAFHVNCDGATEANAQLVRLIHGDTAQGRPRPCRTSSSTARSTDAGR